MDRLSRDRTLKGLSKQFKGDKRSELAHLLVLNTTGKRPEFDSAQWKKAKNFLKKETNGKCAYCEASTDVVAHGDVEHFRPKSVYWWLAYSLENYFFSCQICNQTYKGNMFPIAGNKLAEPDPASTAETLGLTWPDPGDKDSCDDFHRSCLDEQPLLINPLAEDPADWFSYDADHLTQRVKIIPKNSAAQVRAEETIKTLGLNRDELQLLRYEAWVDLDLLCQVFLTTQGRPNEIALIGIKRYLSNGRQFAAMSRHLAFNIHQLDPNSL